MQAKYLIDPKLIKLGALRGWIVDFALCLKLSGYQFTGLINKIEYSIPGILDSWRKGEDVANQVVSFDIGTLVYELGLTGF